MEAKQNSSVGVSATTETHPKHKSHHVLPYMQNRELSWLEFNKRVLDQGEDHNVPLLERLTFVSIFCSNLQEFFMVRVGSLTDLSLVNKDLRDNKTQMTPNEQLQAIYERCHELYPEEERIYNKIMGQLAECGIRQLQPEDLSPEQAEYLRKHLKERVVRATPSLTWKTVHYTFLRAWSATKRVAQSPKQLRARAKRRARTLAPTMLRSALFRYPIRQSA